MKYFSINSKLYLKKLPLLFLLSFNSFESIPVSLLIISSNPSKNLSLLSFKLNSPITLSLNNNFTDLSLISSGNVFSIYVLNCISLDSAPFKSFSDCSLILNLNNFNLFFINLSK